MRQVNRASKTHREHEIDNHNQLLNGTPAASLNKFDVVQ